VVVGVLVLLFLLFFFLVVAVTTAAVHAACAAHVEVVHVVLVPVVAEGLGLVLLVLVDPLRPVGLDVRVLYLLLGQARPVLGINVGLRNIEDDVAALSVPS